MLETQIIIGIPGNWKNRTEIIQSVVSKSEGYLMAGNIIHNSQKNIGFQVEVYDHDPNLKEAFIYASRDTFQHTLLDNIEHHTFTIYIIADAKSIEDVKEVVDVGVGLLKAGGLAVKIESSGVAYTKEDWNELHSNKDIFPLYSHFVTLIGENECYFSCGMKAFGLPDVVISSTIDPEEAADILNNFNLYNIVENPTFNNGETFSVGEDTPVLKITAVNDFRYDEVDLFYNPFGLLELKPI
ncbi:DUF4261 domain-containing protein [Gottfriedia solisilvae]|uniref:DUF4261 domain-containing protein n=1 Tax=Gottfriedia solisilvae TaxID=1516104 RepID=A0A8J3EWE8_9BACI|nr:DUF4261 domain-containing protein [Gottfriedia solisilvae]GGI11601.1 hypothetical protein GCM10007380_08660 [Gottfriedia solisilvae]